MSPRRGEGPIYINPSAHAGCVRRDLCVLAFIALCALLLAGCSRRTLPEDHVYLLFETAEGPFAVRAEVADTDEERQTGLMRRASLPPYGGMLFAWDHDLIAAFWMKDTLIPLDLVYIGSDWRVAEIARGAQPCVADPCDHYYSQREVRYVLEVNAGFMDAHGISEGARIIPVRAGR